MSAADYKALAEVAERMKLKELANYARLRRRDDALTAEIAKLAQTLAQESNTAEAGDVSSALALQRFASIAARQSDKLLAEKRALSAELQAAHQRAVRANGRTEAIDMLISKDRQEEKQRRERQAERMMTQ